MSVTLSASLGLVHLIANSFTLWSNHLHSDRPFPVSSRHPNDRLPDSVPPFVFPILPVQVVHKKQHHKQANYLRYLGFPIPVAVAGTLTGRQVIHCVVIVKQANIHITCLRISADSDTLLSHFLQPSSFLT